VPSQVTRRRLLRVAFGAHLAWVMGVGCAHAAEPDPIQECARRMGLLGEAIQRWKRAHGASAWPSDLVMLRLEGFLTDPRAWICPVSEKSGDFRFAPKDPIVLSASQFNRESNYHYEFSARPENQQYLGDLPPRTMRESKTALAATELGDRVPMLRCKAHGQTTLNLSLDGSIYPSSLYWEYQFSDIRPEPYTMPWMVTQHPWKAGETRAARPSHLSPECLDLETMANGNPELPWLFGRPDRSSLEAFVRETGYGATLKPSPFDARRIVQTAGLVVPWGEFEAGLGFPGQAYPQASRSLPLDGRKARRIVLLGATAFRDRRAYRESRGRPTAPRMVVGELVIQVRDRPPMRVALVYGENFGYWLDAQTGPASAIAWRESDGVNSPVLFRIGIDVSPDDAPSELGSIQLLAHPQSSASPFIVGINLQL